VSVFFNIYLKLFLVVEKLITKMVINFVAFPLVCPENNKI